MIAVRWTPQAEDDLQAIYDFIARDSEHYARLVIEKIIAAVDTIEQLPLIGDTYQRNRGTISEK